MAKEWVVFVTRIEDLQEGQESVLTIRDLSPGPKKYNAKVVRAVLSRHPDGLPEADTLWVRSWTGRLYPQPWAIKILTEAGDYIAGRPHGETLHIIAGPTR
jgi:hypothetical protein